MINSTMLKSTVDALLVPGKGLLAADESFPTIAKRFQEVGIQSTEEMRLSYRSMLFTTPHLSKFISGVILFDETLRQKVGDLSIPELLAQQGIIPGIKVDKGTIPLPGFPGEKITQGLDGLRDRLVEYRQLGARFTKWRAVIAMGKELPSLACLSDNARALALFAAMSQKEGLVPMVEPEVLMDGDHDLGHCEEATRRTLECVFDALFEHRVVLEKMLLKTNMVVSGAECPDQAHLNEVARSTLRCLKRTVPSAVPGVVFLSGGQSDELATQRLSAICAMGAPSWKLSFSFGRALQSPALAAWKGIAQNIPEAQKALCHRASENSLAVERLYVCEPEAPAS